MLRHQRKPEVPMWAPTTKRPGRAHVQHQPPSSSKQQSSSSQPPQPQEAAEREDLVQRRARGGGEEDPLTQETNGEFVTLLLVACSMAIVLAYSDRSNLATAVIPMGEQLGWSESYSGVLLGSFFGGYLLTQLAGGAIADRRGGRMVLLAGLGVWYAPRCLTEGEIGCFDLH